jgi:hypothetical protein
VDYSGEPAPQAFVELLERLRELPGVHRLTSAAAVTSTGANGDSGTSSVTD